MPSLLIAACLWLHALATVVFIGHYVLQALIYQPALFKTHLNEEGARVFAEIARLSRPWLYAALLVFAVTGYLLMLDDPSYLGLGQFSNPWSWLMLAKHLIIVGMVAAGFWFHGILKVGRMLSANVKSPSALASYRNFHTGMAAAGVLVMLLTALAQVR